MALQETLASQSNYALSVDGYKSFVVFRTEEFRGHAVLVDNRYPSYEVPHGIPQILHVKVAGIPKFGKPIHIIGVYMPSGGNFPIKCRALIIECINISDEIFQQDNEAIVVCLGDFNMDCEMLDKRLNRHGLHALRRHTPKGSPASQFPKRGKVRAIDYILVTPRGEEVVHEPKVKTMYEISDHHPVVAHLNSVHAVPWERPVKMFRVNNKMVQKHGQELVNDNRWLALLNIRTKNAEQLSEEADMLSETVRKVCTKCGAFQEETDVVYDFIP